MSTRILSTDENGSKIELPLTTIPDRCPICHSNIEPVFINAYCNGSDVLKPMQIIYKCPRHKCDRLFIAMCSLKYRDYRAVSVTTEHKLLGCVPVIPIKKKFDDELLKVSPDFCKIYNESHAAEQYGLLNVCGAGYRKSLEFLIKDYLISLEDDPTIQESIKEMWLGNLIKTIVTDTKLKKCASRAAWLGNDEAHYTRIWEDNDLADLKILIDLSLHWIESSLLTEKYSTKMDPDD